MNSCAPSRAWAISARMGCAIRSRPTARRWIRPSAWPRATADMLHVVAWPVLAEADDTALRRLRARYHPSEADLIGPHFTLVFGADAREDARLRGLLDGLAGQRAFWFVPDRLVPHDL